MQLGALHAYVDKVFAGVVGVFSYSAFLAIPYRAAGSDLFDYYERVSAAGEHTYMALFLDRYWRELMPGARKFPLAGLLESLAGRATLTPKLLRQLDRATRDYVDEEMAPSFVPGAVNLIGFSLNYDQIYASVYMARYIQERYAQFTPTFLFGGYSTSVPHVVGLMNRLSAPGCLVIGEGEKKLELIIRAILAADRSDEIDAVVAAAAPGVYEVRANVQVFETRADDYATQLPGLTELPVPDYREYFRALEGMTDDAETYKFLVAKCHIMVEGSRGCFAKCDFCGLNSTWRGFRKSTPDAIYAQIVELAERHESTRFDFVDNVCDTWAEKFADRVMASRTRFATLFELRAHHDEGFWTKLALAGAVEIQIGIESLSQPLLSHIGKGTRVVQNVAVQKFLTELGVWSYGNIITDHPRSTVADVIETRRLLEQCAHLGEFGLAIYGVAPGSPLYNSLPLEDRQALRPNVTAKLPRSVVPFALENFCAVPARLECDPETKRAWKSFRRWFGAFRKESQARKATLAVSRLGPHKLLVVDTRREPSEHHILDGDECAVYDACHAGIKLHHLPALVELAPERTMAAVEALLRRQILLRIDDSVISIAVRPRDELVQNLYRAKPARAEQAPLVQLAARRAAS
ncbi:MAG TPA: hypothetical protein VIU61_15180 [Kofleriaceae bacterium]